MKKVINIFIVLFVLISSFINIYNRQNSLKFIFTNFDYFVQNMNWKVIVFNLLSDVCMPLLLIIGAALYFRAPAPVANPGDGPTQVQGDLNKLAKVDAKEHIKGNLNAPVKIIEYSDLECPFCKTFHLAMN